MAGFFSKLVSGLTKTRDNIVQKIDNVFSVFTKIDDEFYEELEETLILGDLGVNTTMEIIERLKEQVKEKHIKDAGECKALLIDTIREQMDLGENAYEFENKKSVILVIGVNGVGKTTSIGKLAAQLKAQNKKVLLAAADTFRAAAIEQLTEWANRAGVDIIAHNEGSDPAAVIYDAISAGKARNADVIICDTAGRLHNKKNLMEELAKIYRVIDRELPYSDREVLLVLDATTGQNAVNQAREFAKIAEITGIILTKLDGTARGGVVLSIKNDLKVPVKFIGVGEGIDDLQPFNPRAFAEGLFEALPEDYEEDEIDLSKIKEEIPVTDDTAVDERAELAKAVGEFFEALQEAQAEDEAEAVEETAEEIAEEIPAEEEFVEEVIAEELAEAVEPEVAEDVPQVEENTEEPAEEPVAEPVQEQPKKKKGFFGRLFG